jgi:hypothetical protein
VLKVTFLSSAVALVRHLDLSNILSKELAQIISRFSALKGRQIVAHSSYVPSFFICHLHIIII